MKFHKILNWDILDSKNLIKGPTIVPMHRVLIDPTQTNERDIKHYLSKDRQQWYFEPITCIKKDELYEVNGLYAHSMVAALRRLGDKDLLVCYVEKKITN